MKNDMLAAFMPNRAVSRTTTGLLVIAWAVIIMLWWMLYPSPIVPKPVGVLDAFAELWNNGGLFAELLTSLWLNVEALAISTAITLGLSYLTVLAGVRPPVAMISKLRFLGFTGLTFLFGLVVTGHALKVWMLVFGVTVFFVTSMTSVVAAIPREKFDHARTIRMGPWRTVYEVVVLGTLDQAIEALRQNAAMGWMMLTMVEGLVRSEGGVGVLMLNENKHFKLESVFAIQLTILVVGLLQDYGIGVLKNMLCPYSTIKLERR